MLNHANLPLLQTKPLTMYSINRTPSISYNPTTSKYTFNFAGKAIETTVTDKVATADEWVLEILSMYANQPTEVGLDIERRPHQISYLSNKSATLQLCIENKCLILQLFYMNEIPEKLKAFLSDPNFTYVGIEVGGDIEKLRNEYGLDCSKSEDVREAAKRWWVCVNVLNCE